MITLNKVGDYHNRQVLEIECLKADEKPIGTIDGLVITNGSKLHELDGDTYEYDEQNKTWVLQPKSSGGADGREIELQKTQTHIQWRYVGTEEWFDLVSLDDLSFKYSDFSPEQLQALKGAKGDKGNPGANGTNGKDGLSIKSTQINDSGHLILTFTDESTKDVGKVTGENGENAYQIAIKLGYKGTEQEWIESLKYDHSEEFTKLAAEVRNTTANIVAERQQITQNTNDVTKLKEDLKGYVPKNQGVENNGKILGIGADGIVVPVDKPSGGSGGGVDLDATLTSPDKAAPAKIVGEFKKNLSIAEEALGIGEILPRYNWDGYFYICENGNKIKILPDSASACKLSRDVKVRQGDIVVVKSKLALNRAIIAFSEAIMSEVYTPLCLSKNANGFMDYTATIERDGFIVVCCSTLNGDIPEEFSFEIKRKKSEKLESCVQKLEKISTPLYYGVKNDENLILGYNISKRTSTMEIIFKINKEDMTTKWFYGNSTQMFGLHKNINGTIMASLNVGGYETVNLYNRNYKNEAVHVVLIANYETHTKKCYLNGKLLKETTNNAFVNDANEFIDTISGGVAVYQKRTWRRELSDSEIENLYNNGYPTERILTEKEKEGLVHEFTANSISETSWSDYASPLVSNFVKPTFQMHNPFNIYGHLSNTKKIIEKDVLPVLKKRYFPDFEIKTVKRGSHDCTFIGDCLVSFCKPSDGNASFIDVKNYTRTSTKKINFIEPVTNKELEMKSCDYKYNKLLVGNGRAIKYGESDYTEQGSRLYVFHEANTWRESMETEITLENCGTYDMIDVSELGYKVYGFWGGFEDMVYISCNLFNDIYLIQLGKGVNNLGKGSFSSVSEGRYNGSFTIIGYWHQDNNLGSWSAHGGQYYKGNLYIATNDTNVCQIYKCILNDNGELRFDVLDFDVRQPSDSAKMQYKYINGLCIKDDVLYAQPLTVGESYDTNFDTFIVSVI